MMARIRSLLVILLLVVTSVTLTTAAIEVAARLRGREPLLAWEDYRGHDLDLYRGGLPIAFDARLGWVPKVGYAGTNNQWHTRVTILDGGIRSNGNQDLSLPDRDRIVVVGDSFTFGDQVSDGETWPAVLERLTQRRVINGGVFAYGVDQSFLRLADLIAKYKPTTVVFSLIPDDIRRCEFATLIGGNKPYFVLSGNDLQVANLPLRQPKDADVGALHRLLGHSYALHQRMMACCPNWWLRGHTLSSNPTGQNGVDITCAVLRDLGPYLRANGVRDAYVLVQYFGEEPPAEHGWIERVKTCVDPRSVQFVDLWSRLLEIQRQDPARYRSFFSGHMTYQGNRFVADEIQEAMAARAAADGHAGAAAASATRPPS